MAAPRTLPGLLLLLCTLALAPAAQSLKLAVIGDFGVDTSAEASVATLVHSFVDGLGTGGAVATVGDNNYCERRQRDNRVHG